jgi:hypothetical protein
MAPSVVEGNLESVPAGIFFRKTTKPMRSSTLTGTAKYQWSQPQKNIRMGMVKYKTVPAVLL